MRNTTVAVLTIVLLLGPVEAVPLSETSDYAYEAEHKRFLRAQSGRLTISPQGVAFHADDGEDRSHAWSYEEIRELRIESPRRVRIVTYEDVAWRLNRNRSFSFELTDGEITPRAAVFLADRLPTPLVTAVFPEPEQPILRLPVKHGHALGGGCHGELVIADEAVFFESERAEHGRWWPVEHVESVGSTSEFDFRITTWEGSFHFQLKRPLDRGTYEDLWRRVHEPVSWVDELKFKR